VDDVFCEVDGTRLATGQPVLAAARSAKTLGACPSCGASDPNDGDGYCSACGYKLSGGGAAPDALLPVGATIGGRVITSVRDRDDFAAKDPSGREVTVAVGAAESLALEAEAARALAGPGFPAIQELGADARRGAFLALSPPPAGAARLVDVGKELSLDGALALVDRILDVAATIERAGFAWQPQLHDVYLREPGTEVGQIVLGRVRVARNHGGVDASAVLEGIGAAFLPEPAVCGPIALVRLLAPHGPAQPRPRRSIAEARADLLLAAKEGLLDTAGVAAACDPGMRRDHNEDATALAQGETRGEKWAVLVVCDGVSSSTHADQASTIASKTACDALAHFARSGDITHEGLSGAMSAAIRAAHLAVCAQGIEPPLSPASPEQGLHETPLSPASPEQGLHETPLSLASPEQGLHENSQTEASSATEPPGTTIVAAVVYRRRITVGWVGDSRAYWITDGGGELLTRDHSWVNEAVGRGEMTEEQALQQPLAHALTRCLGPLEVGDAVVEVEPEVRARDLPGSGHIILCSDGLWNYFPNAGQISALVKAAGPGALPAQIARRLVNHANAKGGQDNVSVAVYAFAPFGDRETRR
jgi:serine/threonine protein phosphatase PrpC